MTTGRDETLRACVIGWPIAHSRSPIIHRYWLAQHRISGSYEKLAVQPSELAGFIAGMAARGFVGGNVTIPHKEAAASLCARLTPAAKRLGAVNTLWFEQGELVGDSTDGQGFVSALDQDAPGWDDRKGLALVLGAGGAARAIVDVLQQRGFSRVVVANRTPERAAEMAARFGCEAAGLDATAILLPAADLLVNTTAAGMAGQDALPIDVARLPNHAVVDDIVYVPLVTPLLRQAEARGLRVVVGLGMLLHQAVPGFERWFGVRPAVTAELRARVEADILEQP